MGERQLTHGTLCIDLFCGLGGWAEGFLAEGYRVVGFDIERHDYGNGGYPGQLVLQDALTLHGSQFRDAAVIVASPPCQEFSYMAMPWSRAKQIAKALEGHGEFPEGYTGSRTVEQLTALFDCCFRIQREAEEAAGRHIPLIVENVRGAQRWVGRAKWHFGSYYLWGDLPALMPHTFARKLSGFNMSQGGEKWNMHHRECQEIVGQKTNPDGTGHPPGSWFKIADSKNRGARSTHLTNQAESDAVLAGVKQGGDWFGRECQSSISRMCGSKSPARKAASAAIAKIPFPLANHIARAFRA